jgi:hypothetical protein
LIPTNWWSIYSGLPWRPIISLDVYDYIYIKSVRSISYDLSVTTNIFYHLASRQLTTSIHWPCNCTVNAYGVIHFLDSMWSFWVESNLCKFCIVYWYLCYRWGSNYQQGNATIPTPLIPHHLCVCPQPGPVCPTSYEEFEDTKGVIRIRISKKSRQHNGQKKKVQKDICRGLLIGGERW